DNMINGTKLLNVVGMSRGKRDGILKNEKGRRVVKVGPMHLKGVWIPFERARFLADQFKVVDVLFPIFQPDPNSYLYGTLPINSPTTAAGLPSAAGSDPYSAAAAGYSQLTRAQDAYDHSMVIAAAA
ncbi:Cell pattern formation-associated protein ust1, partial [Coemansia sp. RSA 2607]